jgi:putative transposase
MVKKTAHCAYDIHYHLVVVMKYRKNILKEEKYISYLCNVLKGISERYEFEVEEIGCDGNHVHVLLSCPPRYSPSNVMQIMKSISARMMFKRFPEIKNILWGGELWSDGGFVGTVGQTAGLEHLKKYVKNQGKKKTYNLSEYLN